MKIYEASSVEEFLNRRLTHLPNNGRGELSRMCEFTGIHTTTMSQIFKGTRQLSLEQGAQVCEYLGFNKLETRAFMLLLQKQRAGSEALKEFFSDELKTVQQDANELVNLIPHQETLTGEDRAMFYSHWYYAGIAVLCAIPQLQTPEELSLYTGLPLSRTKEVLEFLVRTGICREQRGKFVPGTSSTHLESKSPLVARHHANWRIKAIEQHSRMSVDELAYSAPMALSAKDVKLVRALLVDTIQEIAAIREPSVSEKAFVLNIDWTKI